MTTQCSCVCAGFPGLKDLGYEGYLDGYEGVTTEPTPVDRSLDLGMRDSGVLYYGGNSYSAGKLSFADYTLSMAARSYHQGCNFLKIVVGAGL